MGGKRIAIGCLVAGALVGGGVAGGIAEASSSPAKDTPSRDGSKTGTATVVRTTLTSTVQVGGSIGYQGSYAIAAPSGAGAAQIAQDQQAVTQSELALSTDQTAASDSAVSDRDQVAAGQDAVNAAAAALAADRAVEAKDCAGPGAGTPACTQDAKAVGQDQTQYGAATQQLTAARNTAARDHDQNQAKLASDANQLQAARANLAQLQATAANPGTTYTWLPKPGQIISEDQRVYSVSNLPVPLLYGSISAYRAFQVGMPAGADVGELTRDLISLGFGAGLTQSDSYTSATAVAVGRWQTALGVPATGSILLGQVVFEPGPIRVTTVTPAVGQAVGGSGGGTVLTATSPTPVVTVALDVTEEYLVKVGDAVTVVLPDGTTTVGGRVQTVGNVATCPGGGGSGSGAGLPDESPCSSSGSGSNSSPTVSVTVTLDSTPPGATLDQAPVNVDVTTDRAENVLAVPVNALLALQGGGYGVDVVSGGTTELVAVTTGLYSNTLVEISGAGITAGTKVEVPSS